MTPSRPTDDEQIRQLSIDKYRRRAAQYDQTLGPTSSIRQRAIAQLGLVPGQTVLDVGCGTGASLQALVEAVGPAGHVIGFDQSPEMLGLAIQKSTQRGWRNVTLLEASAQTLRIHRPVDAFLFHYTHDILQSPQALNALLTHAAPGARVSIAGICYFPWWLEPLNLVVYLKNRPYNGSPGGLRRPWALIESRLEGWTFTRTQFGMGYLASGRLKAAS